jgi:hypothetical protein
MFLQLSFAAKAAPTGEGFRRLGLPDPVSAGCGAVQDRNARHHGQRDPGKHLQERALPANMFLQLSFAAKAAPTGEGFRRLGLPDLVSAGCGTVQDRNARHHGQRDPGKHLQERALPANMLLQLSFAAKAAPTTGEGFRRLGLPDPVSAGCGTVQDRNARHRGQRDPGKHL